MSKEERTGFRDRILSLRHRHYGRKNYAIDLDYIECSSKHSQIELNALIESKLRGDVEWHKATREQRAIDNTFQMRVMQMCAERLETPLFKVCYSLSKKTYVPTMFEVTPYNKDARDVIPVTTFFDERGYARFLHDIRGLTFDKDEWERNCAEMEKIDWVKSQKAGREVLKDEYLEFPDTAH